MATSVAKLAVELLLKHGRFDSELSKSGKNVKGFGKDADAGTKALLKLGKAAAAAALGGGLAIFIKSNLDAVDTLAKTSDKLGIGVEKLQAYRLAAEQMAGVGNQQFDMALQRMTRRLAEAENGTGEAVKALEALGVSIEELRGKSPDQQMRIIADAMQGVESQSQQLAIAFKLFDSEGAALVNMLKDGSAGLDAMDAKAKALGLTMTREQARRVEEANDAWNSLGTSMSAVGQNIVVALAPALKVYADALVDITGGAEQVNQQMAKELALRDQQSKRYERIITLSDRLDEIQRSGSMDDRLDSLHEQDQLLKLLVDDLKEQQRLGADQITLSERLAYYYDELNSATGEYVETVELGDAKFTRFGRVLNLLGVELRGVSRETESAFGNIQSVSNVVSLTDILAQLEDRLRRVSGALDTEAVVASTEHYNKFADAVDKTREKLVASIEQMNLEAAARDKLPELMGAEIYMRQLAALEEAKIQQTATLQFYQENEQLLVDNHLRQMEMSEQQSATRLKALWQRSWADKAEITASAFSGLSSLMQSEYRSLFEIGKAAAIAETVFSTYAAAQKQFDYFSAINPVLAYAAAASAVAAGLVRVQAIRNTRFGSSSVQSAQAATATSAASGQGSQSTGSSGFNQEIVVQGSVVDVETLSDTFRDAAERNITITGIRSASNG